MLRAAKPSDAESIGKVRVAAWRAAYKAFMPQGFLDNLDAAANLSELKNRLSSQSPAFTVSIAEDQGAVVAFSIIGRPRYEASPETLELWAVNVLPRFWQRGIGSRLVERAIRYAASEGFNRLELWCIEGNLPAERTYKKLGFRASARRRSSSNLTGHTLHETHYIKTISR